jgi:hypothetical protein
LGWDVAIIGIVLVDEIVVRVVAWVVIVILDFVGFDGVPGVIGVAHVDFIAATLIALSMIYPNC